MKHGFYPHLAADGIRKNRQLYLPYLFTQAGMVMMLYIILFLPKSPAVQAMNGSRTISSMLYFGSWVMALFACIFLFYTNSFLIRRRKKEFGLYNILGMGKRNIGVILFWETLLNYALSLAGGLVLGFAFSKLAELGLIRLMGGKTDFNLSVSGEAVVMTALAFGVISILLLINSLTQVRLSSAVALMRSEHQGEKPPRANWVLGLLGVVLLGYAYYISLTIQDPVAALGWFFVAVLLVILATYLLMVAGSVLLCRVLQKNKRYYYRPEHFVSVSSMAYRMKRNGAGLASICILATMILVMLSSSACLYFGAEDSLNASYPYEVDVTVWANDAGALPKLQEKLEAVGAPYGVDIWRQGSVTQSGGEVRWSGQFNTGLSRQQQLDLGRDIDEALNDPSITWGYSRAYRAEAADEFYGTYGSLFFIGIVLSVMFIGAAVMMMYYKQLCEGYEDQPRFAMMQKVGMTAADIRASVNSQMLTVFFLPLAGAALHMAFAFPMIRRMLLVFQLNNTGLFVATALISFAVLAAAYTLVYRITSRAYYRIVRNDI